jgi:alkanesulfonate monooxygenase SsuD/methylene tetrahydromethanopterin reductase-like flavin-dependent oxidoreductase (luciferase family)
VKFGISFLPDVGPEIKRPEEYLRDALELSVLADRLGFSHAKITEHYGSYYGGYCPNPLTFLAGVASRTSSIRLMTGGIQASFNNPIKVAAEAAMVDCMSGGRLDVGFVRAFLPFEFDMFQVEMDDSRRIFERNIRKVMACWTGSGVQELAGSPAAPFVVPQPLQRPFPPIWVAAVRSRESFAWIGEMGFGLLVTTSPGPEWNLGDMIAIYRESFVPMEGGLLDEPVVALSMPICVAETQSDAIRICDAHAERYLRSWELAVRTWQGRQSAAYVGYEGFVRVLAEATPRQMRENGKIIAGSPADARVAIEQLRAALGIDIFLWQVDFGGMKYPLAANTMELLASSVLPALGPAVRTGS